MTVKELIEKLKLVDPEAEIVVEDSGVHEFVGTTPFLKIINIWVGFDWDAGKVYIKTSN